MNLRQRSILLLCIAMAAIAHAQERNALPEPGKTLAGAALTQALQRGGFTLYFRHTRTDVSQNDRDTKDFDDCARQRNLSDAGRGDARATAVAMRALKLVFSEVLASPYCRTMETARLMTGRASATREVLGAMTPGGKPDYSALETILATPPARGTLRIISSHGNPFAAIAGAPHLAEGEAAVIRGDGSRWTIVARIPVSDWPRLALGE
ncbi:MAG: hypothetical protein M3R58_15075 [Pseudomonadota bacterium]|nr:hypothetical protein [Pseudomonadota bacterium]